MSDLSAEQFVEALLSEEAHAQPSDRAKESELVMQLPPWFDEEQFNRGRKFFDNFSFSFSSSMLMGLVAVFSVPSILRILISTRRSNSVFTAYRRYLSTLLHTISWFEHELKPGSTSWRSLYTVRTRHLRAGLAAKSKGLGTVSQRDIALTQFGFIGFSFLKPEAFGIRQLRDGDWEAYNHFWRVIVYMIGLDDRYNICRKTADETRKVCQLLQDRVFTPCLENVPEYFEHSARVMLDGMWSVNPTVDVDSNLWWCKYLADVPGYVYSEKDRIRFQSRLREQLEGKPLDTGVPSSSLMAKPALEGLPDVPPRLHYYKDYSSLESSPAYQTLTIKNKYKLYIINLYMYLYGCGFGRWYFNINFKFSLYLMRYFPYVAFFRFGIKKSLTNIFEEDPIDDTKPKLNSEYTKKKANVPWYEWLYVLFW